MMQADRSAEKRLMELATRAERTGIPQYTGFLTPAEQRQADVCARAAGCAMTLCGGPEGAERQVAAFTDTADDPLDFPIACLQVRWDARYGSLGHRDLLGAVLGLGIAREKIGDLYVQEGVAYLFALREMAAYLDGALTQAGRTPISLQPLEDWPDLSAGEGTTVRATVMSVRLDAVLGAAFGLSRAKAAALIASGRVQVNHLPEERSDAKLSQGAVLSVRGMGRARLDEIGGQTKKGRTGIALTRY